MAAGKKMAGLDTLETVMLGGAPGDALGIPSGAGGTLRDPRVSRLDSLRGLMEDHPAMRKEAEGEVGRLWAKAKGDKAAFQASVGELRAQVLSRAEADRYRRQAPEAAARAQGELARYLAEIEGMGGGSGGRSGT